jgi:hypothetical protein
MDRGLVNVSESVSFGYVVLPLLIGDVITVEGRRRPLDPSLRYRRL